MSATPDASPVSSGLLTTAPLRPSDAAPEWFLNRSKDAWTAFQSLPLPGLKDENWRYSSAK